MARDVHFQSLRQQIEPVIFYHTESRMWGDKRVILVKYESGKASSLINKIQHRWNGLAEASPFEFYFYDEEVKQRYNQELRLGSLFTIFTGLSITIAVIGLVGLVSYSAEQRKKEIGIRKVFGASLTRIYIMMNGQYIKLIFIAVLIATPITWWFMQQWLNSYRYKIEINVLIDQHPFYSLSGSDNIILLTTERYHDRPMVIRGPGAGAHVTAAGVFADIIRIGHYAK